MTGIGPSAESLGQSVGFFSRYTHVLFILVRDPDVTIREMSIILDVTERTVHVILNQLEQQGFIQIDRQGRKNSYQVLLDARSKSRFEQGCTVREILKMISDS